MILTNSPPRAPPKLAPDGSLYVPLLGVLHWRCPSSLRSDTRMHNIGMNGRARQAAG
jgi:hypothetical protein